MAAAAAAEAEIEAEASVLTRSSERAGHGLYVVRLDSMSAA